MTGNLYVNKLLLKWFDQLGRLDNTNGQTGRVKRSPTHEFGEFRFVDVSDRLHFVGVDSVKRD